MKNLLRYLAFVLMVGGAFAQSQRPECVKPSLSLAKILPAYTELNNCTNNQGTMVYPSGEQYSGQWRNGKRDGFGTIYYPNGKAKFAGQFKNDEINGRGTEYSLIGSVIAEGNWVDGRFVSPSKIEQTSASNNVLVSDFANCQGVDVSRWSNCIGAATSANDNKYVGQWKNGKRDGLGTVYYPSGNAKFTGEFKNDEINGKGTEYSLIGSVIAEGIWANGKFVSSETFKQVDSPNFEIERLRAEAEEAKRKQAELENQLRLAQQPVVQQSNPTKISQRESKRIALVIGNANYASAPLKNPLNDAADISASLRQSGFEVIDQRNATLQEMTRGIREFGDKLLKSDVGLVYYSGHGLEVKGRNYLLPVNASMIREDEIAFQAIDANLILEKMNTAKKSVNILIVDACRDNPFARSFRSVNRGLAQMDAPTGTIVSFSTAPGKTASDGDGRNSPFTKNLVKAMTRADMPIEAMFKEVRKSVVEETKGLQTPWESSSLIGDFYFKVSK